MKKLSTPAALALLCLAFAAAPARAQESQAPAALDNFDLANGVRVAPAQPPPAHKYRMTPLHRAELARSAPRVRLTSYAYSPTLSMAAASSLDGFTTGDTRIDSYIAGSGRRHGVDPVLIYSIMHRESAFKRNAVSNKGARGLMQLMPATAARFGVRDIFDPAQNIDAGARYMRFLLDRFGGDVRLALAGYNAGEGADDKYNGVPPYRETQEYVRRIGERYTMMRNPEIARRAPAQTLAAAEAANEAATPQPLYERNVYAVRLPDGKLMLVSQ